MESKEQSHTKTKLKTDKLGNSFLLLRANLLLIIIISYYYNYY